MNGTVMTAKPMFTRDGFQGWSVAIKPDDGDDMFVRDVILYPLNPASVARFFEVMEKLGLDRDFFLSEPSDWDIAVEMIGNTVEVDDFITV